MEEVENRLKKFLKDERYIKFAYLFGSYAINRFNKISSDIDIAVYIEDSYDIFEKKLELHHKLEKIFKKEIDLVVLNKVKSYTLLKDILDNGILVKDSSDDSREMFELRKHHEIIDFKVFQGVLENAS